ncbi:hypothetical protein FJO69_02035 [[Mycoplasma] falconis]|uniref:Uncharacterized protein n=1 Tax=[Mycoplasma] falconis TaxID=92403 RepID=A0A501XA69_9BACT|nr:hypothetical protein [[Mycoplasma] falconis]TPE57267.1 hypothetical protein FJO69_02035 [[Mycoplasma] falconis]
MTIEFISESNYKNFLQVENLEINVNGSDAWTKIQTNSIGSFKICFFRVKNNDEWWYFILENVFIKYFNDNLVVNYSGKLNYYLEDLKDIKEYKNILKVNQTKINEYKALQNLNPSSAYQTQINNLELEDKKIKYKINFSLGEAHEIKN